MLRINLNAKAWKNLREVYADQPIPLLLDMQNRFAGMWLSLLERMAYAPHKTSTKLPEIIFVIGHWRSGTTFLHEMLSQDQNFNFPSTYACMNPQVFPITEESLLKRSGNHISHRPMDKMSISLASPQEDEFALLGLGARSPYEGLLFPKTIERGIAAADPNDLPEAEMQQWVSVFITFVKQISARKPGCPIILKSPTHSYRVKFLSQLFPEARFVHIVRNPLDVYNSTLNMWQKLCSLYALTELPDENKLSRNVIVNWLSMEEKLDISIPSLQENNYALVRYEALVSDTVAEMARIYAKLSLGDFSVALPHIENYLISRKNFTKNRYELAPSKAKKVYLAWKPIFEKYGYTKPIYQA